MVNGDDGADLPAAADREAAWQSEGETEGAWLELSWRRSTRVDHLEIRAAGDAGTTFTSALLTFDGRGSLMVTLTEDGVATVDFTARDVSRARLTIVDVPDGATSVALAALSIDASGDDGGRQGGSTGRPVVTSSSSTRSGTSALVDGDPAGAETGQEWSAAGDDAAPWVQFAWDSVRELASVQVFGPSQTAFDPSYSAAAPLHGRLVFDDGSTVVISGIAGSTGQATTIAFTPRMASSVRLELAKTIPAAVVGLREVAFYDAGTTPPRWPKTRGGYTTTSPAPVACGPGATAVTPPQPDQLTLVCPSPGSAVDDTATVVVAAAPGTSVQATAWQPSTRSMARVAAGTTGRDGRAVLSFGTADLSRGPLTVKVVTTLTASTPLYVQLINPGGTATTASSYAPEGMTLQWDEEFTDPLSITATGADAVYAATKPAYWGPSEFGDAVFADPASGAGNISTVDQDYLRIRAEPIGDRDVPTPFGQDHLGGIVSSLHVGASGFAAQYGYYEARMLGAPGTGTWPAFWMLDSQSATRSSTTSGEVDGVELYGHNPVGSCHSLVNWSSGQSQDPEVNCLEDNGLPDWSMTWHTWGVRIIPNGAIYYIDGTKVATATGLAHHSDPFYFMVNLALGGGWPTDLTPTGDISDLYVDWIHVYT
nr:glycoside hydrolase family 16 protein [Modestobacter altitudinis]